MKFKSAFLALSAASLAMLASACSTCVGISPSTTPITENDTYVQIGATGKAKGTSTGVVWFIVPTFPDNQSELAKADALKNSGGDALIEVTEEYKVSCFLFVTYVTTTVQGTAIKIKRGGAL